MKNCLFQQGLQTLFDTVSDEIYIFCFNFKKYHLNLKIPFFKQNMSDTKINLRMKNCLLQ